MEAEEEEKEREARRYTMLIQPRRVNKSHRIKQPDFHNIVLRKGAVAYTLVQGFKQSR